MFEYGTGHGSGERLFVRQETIYSRQRATVVTILERELRGMVSMVAGEAFNYVHADSIESAGKALADPTAHAVLVSPAAFDMNKSNDLSLLLHRNPGVVSVAVVSQLAPAATEQVLSLGRAGVAEMVDLGGPDGFQRLRSTLETRGGLITRRISDVLSVELLHTSVGFQAFVGQVVRLAPTHTTVLEFANRINVGASTLASRFRRVGLPSPRTYLARTRLLYAAAYLESKVLSIAQVAHRLEYSSPQSFGRNVRLELGLTASAFRRQEFGLVAQEFVEGLLRKHSETLASFDPFRHPQ